MSTKDMYEKDYYKILGVSKDADSATIKNCNLGIVELLFNCQPK